MGDRAKEWRGTGGKSGDGHRLTRRRALGAIGAGVLGSAGALATSAQSADATVGGGGDITGDLQSAIDGLSGGRRSKERVVVEGGGTISDRVYIPSYTIVDVRGTVYADGVIPFYADQAQSIEIRNATIEGSPSMGMRIRRSDDVVIDGVSMDVDSGIGIRIDNAYNDGSPITTTNVQIGTVEISGTGSHAVETYGVDGIDIDTVRTWDSGGCGLLLNDTTNAEVGLVDATRANEGGGYAGFRCANDAGPDIHVDRVEAVDCGRGIFTVSNSGGIEIEEVYLEGNGGNLIQDSRDVRIGGGTVVGNGGSGFRVDSRNDGRHPHTRNVLIENCRIEGNGGYGVRETGPDTEDNTIRDNVFCDNGDGSVSTYAGSTTVTGNSYECDGTVETPTEAEPEPADPPAVSAVQLNGTYRVENVNSGHVLSVENGSTSDSASVVQRPYDGAADQHWTFESLGDGVHRIENAASGSSLDVLEAQVEDGAEVIQYPWGGNDNQRFLVGEGADGDLAIVAQHSNRVLDVYEKSTDAGANVVQWTDNGGDNQRWTAVAVDDDDGGDGPGPVGDNDSDPQDPDGDGLYEDVNGNGDQDLADAVDLFQNRESAAVQDHVDAYDFSGNGEIDLADVVDLFQDNSS